MPSRASSARTCRSASPSRRRKGCCSACSEATEMGLLDLFRSRNRGSANVAKERLRIIVAQERSVRGAPDYLPLLKRELLEVIRKYVNVDPEAVQVEVDREDGHEVLELSVTLPDKATASKAS